MKCKKAKFICVKLQTISVSNVFVLKVFYVPSMQHNSKIFYTNVASTVGDSTNGISQSQMLLRSTKQVQSNRL